MNRLGAITLALAVLACGRNAGSGHQNRDKADPPVSKNKKNAVDTSTKKLTWAAYTITKPALRLDVFADQTELVKTPGDGFVTYLHENGPARLVVWIGRDQTLTAWRTRLGARGQARFDTETDVSICGVKGRRQTATVAAAPPATGLVRSGDGTIGHIHKEFPEMVHVTVGFSVAGSPVLMSWIIRADQRAAYAADEAHFFAAVRCPAAP